MKKEKYTWKQCAKDIWLILEGKRALFVFWTSLRVMFEMLIFIPAYALGKIADFFLGYSRGEPLGVFYMWVAVIAVSGTLNVWMRFFVKYRMQMIAAEARKDARIKAMDKLMSLELKWHEKEETGSKIEKINKGGESIYDGLREFSNSGIFIITSLAGSIILFATLEIKYALIGFLYASVYLCGEYFLDKRISYWQNKMNIMGEKVSGKVHESASNLLTVKSLGLKAVFSERTGEYENKYMGIWTKAKQASQRRTKIVKILSSMAYAVFVLILGLDAAFGAITVGTIFIFASYFGKLKDSLHEVTDRSEEFIKFKAGLGRFMTIFREDVFEDDKKEKMPESWEKIEFRNVTFRYKHKNALENFSISIRRNEKIGIAGKSGCGKSTLAKLLLGLYTPQKGRILVDGKDLRKFSRKSITDNVGIVLQDSEMFNMSLLNNITVSSISKDYKMFRKAAEIAGIDEFAKNLPKGLNTIIGEKGYRMSGGERQRIGIARAVYKSSPMLILDEATSSLDSKTESRIQEMLQKELKASTMIVIAHRLSTLRDCEKIIMMDNGSICEEGKFSELVEKKGKFYEMLMIQQKK